MKSYHQTQSYLDAEQVQAFTVQAVRQEDLILDFFKSHAGESFSPEAIQEQVLQSAPITSVRRAITNLTTAGQLVKCGSEQGRYGRPVGLWKLAKGQLELF